MKQFTLLLTITLTICGLLLVVGCEKNDSGTNSNDQTDLGPADSAFVTEMLGSGMFEGPVQSLDISMALVTAQFGVELAGKQSPAVALQDYSEDSVLIDAISSYTYSNGWHIFQFEATVYETGEYTPVLISGIDSVQLLFERMPLQFPDESSDYDQVLTRAHVTFATADQESLGAFHHHLNFSSVISGSDTLIELDGSAYDSLHFSIVTDESSCDFNLYMGQTVSDLLIDPNSDETDCPLAGAINISATIDLSCTGVAESEMNNLNVNGTWIVNAVFNSNNTVTITFSDGTTSWTITESCGDQVAAPSRLHWRP